MEAQKLVTSNVKMDTSGITENVKKYLTEEDLQVEVLEADLQEEVSKEIIVQTETSHQVIMMELVEQRLQEKMLKM